MENNVVETVYGFIEHLDELTDRMIDLEADKCIVLDRFSADMNSIGFLLSGSPDGFSVFKAVIDFEYDKDQGLSKAICVRNFLYSLFDSIHYHGGIPVDVLSVFGFEIGWEEP